MIEAGLSVFVTGPGGTGKSELIHAIRQAAEAKDVRVVVTASTGIAARNIGGITLHRFAGMGLIEEAAGGNEGRRQRGVMRSGDCLARARRFKADDYRLKNWQDVDLLIVDEISMLSVFMLKELDAVARHARVMKGKGIVTQPFGGIQLVFLGDFAQLIPESGGGGASGSGIAKTTPAPSASMIAPLKGAWCEFVPYTVVLKTIFRQRDDSFRAMLNRIRLGVVNQGDLYRLNASVGGETLASGETGPELCAFRKMVQQANDRAMAGLESTQRVVYTAKAINWPDNAESRKEFEALRQELGAELPLTLCVGARVLLTKNLDPDRGLVNGALGKVVGFDKGLPRIVWDHDATSAGGDDGSGEAARGGESDPTPAPAAPTGTLLNPIVVDSTGKVTEYADHSEQQHPSPPSPEAPPPEADSTTTKAKKLLSFMPLLCAWSMTVHRAQGMTLDRVRVNARSMRTPALLYTALSRVRSMAGLQIAGGKVSAENIVAHPQVIAYYNTLQEITTTTSSSTAPTAPLAVIPSVVLAAKARELLGWE